MKKEIFNQIINIEKNQINGYMSLSKEDYLTIKKDLINQINEEINNKTFVWQQILDYIIPFNDNIKQKFKIASYTDNNFIFDYHQTDKNNTSFLQSLVFYISQNSNSNNTNWKNFFELDSILEYDFFIKIIKYNHIDLLKNNDFSNNLAYNYSEFLIKKSYKNNNHLLKWFNYLETKLSIKNVKYKNNDLLDLAIVNQEVITLRDNKSINFLLEKIPFNNTENRHFNYIHNKNDISILFKYIEETNVNIFNNICYNKTNYQTEQCLLEHWISMNLNIYNDIFIDFLEFFNQNPNKIPKTWINKDSFNKLLNIENYINNMNDNKNLLTNFLTFSSNIQKQFILNNTNITNIKKNIKKI